MADFRWYRLRVGHVQTSNWLSDNFRKAFTNPADRSQWPKDAALFSGRLPTPSGHYDFWLTEPMAVIADQLQIPWRLYIKDDDAAPPTTDQAGLEIGHDEANRLLGAGESARVERKGSRDHES